MAMKVEYMTFYVVLTGSVYYQKTINSGEIILSNIFHDARHISSSVEAKQIAKRIGGRVVEFKSSLLEDN